MAKQRLLIRLGCVTILIAGATMCVSAQTVAARNRDAALRPVSLQQQALYPVKPGTQDRVSLRQLLNDLENSYQVRFNFKASLVRDVQVPAIPVAEFKGQLTERLNQLLLPINLFCAPVSKTSFVLTGRKSAPATTDVPPTTAPDGPEAAARRGIPIADRTITGTVLSETGEGLPGVTVALKNTQRGTTTDASGNFQLVIPEGEATLTVSYIGYATQEVGLGNQTRLDLRLIPDNKSLDEVVVVGYGTQKRENLTGAVSTANMTEVLGNRPISSTSQALQGAIPGLQVTYGSGQPGTGTALNIRGFTSINSGSPLVLVNNVPVNIDDINPMDIETVTVLKDASASSIYGARAAFGVILITTKKGARNQPVRFDYSTNISSTRASTLPAKPTPLQFVNALKDFGTVTYWGGQDVQKWQTYLQDYQTNPGNYPNGIVTDNLGTKYPLQQTDLYGALFPGGFEQLHNFAFSGGSEKTNYRVSLGYANEDGIMVSKNDSYKRYNFNAYLNTALTSSLTASVNILYKNDRRTSPANQNSLYYNATTFGPYVKTGYDSTATGEYLPFDSANNYAALESPVNDFGDDLRLFGKLEFNPIKDFKVTAEYTFDKTNTNQTVYTASNRYISAVIFSVGTLNANTRYSRNNSQTNYHSLNVYANYDKHFGNNNFSLLVGTNQEISKQASFSVNRFDVISAQTPAISTSTGLINGDDSFNEFGVAGYFGRLNYNYREKYLLEINGRIDGSSRFAPGHRFGFFPSASAGWNISEEGFMKALSGIVPLLKLRGSWGEVGNQVIVSNGSQNYYPYVPGLVTGTAPWINPATGVRYAGLSAPALVSDGFTWETVRTANIGIDVGLLKNRLTASFDLFNRKTLNMLSVGSELPAVLGAPAPLQNVADLVSKGWETQVAWRDRIKGFQYSVGFNLSDNQAFITKFKNVAGLISQYYVGQTINEIWGFQTQGYFTESDFEAGTLNADLQRGKLNSGIAPYQGVAQNPGDIRYVDLNGDGIINTGNNTLANPGDRSIIGNSTRRFQFGINGSASYRGFDFSFFASGVGKRNLWYNDQVAFPYANQFGGIFLHQLDYWTKTNPSGYYPRVYKDGAGNTATSKLVQTKYLSSGAYLRVKNVTFGYTIPQAVSRKVFLDKVRVFFSGENLLTFDRLPSGMDPEATNQNLGAIYPFIKKYSFGLNASF